MEAKGAFFCSSCRRHIAEEKREKNIEKSISDIWHKTKNVEYNLIINQPQCFLLFAFQRGEGETSIPEKTSWGKTEPVKKAKNFFGVRFDEIR